MGERTLLRSCAVVAAVLAAAGAQAADAPGASLPTTKGPILAESVSWDGFYFGVNGGVADSFDRWSDPTGHALLVRRPRFPASGNSIGEFGGLTVGYNRQFGPWVVGVEGDIDASTVWGHAVCGGVWGGLGGDGWRCLDSDRVFGAATARVGYATGRALLFAKAGVAVDDYNAALSYWRGSPHPDPTISQTEARVGATIGVGMEYALSPNWSAKGEYDLIDYGKRAFSGSDPAYPAAGVWGASLASLESLFKLGLNYRIGGDATQVAAPAPAFASDVVGEFGVRTGWSSGYFRKDLYSRVVAGQLNSRLTWPDQSGIPLEAFARFDHSSGVFAKGFVGGVDMFNSHMHDEDFPPASAIYSNTLSSTKNGRDIYGTIDVGYAYPIAAGWKLGAFVGYNHYADVINAYGCTQQVAANPGCAPGDVALGELNQSENEHWDSLRLGANLDALLTDRIKVELDAAWLPYSAFSATDNHWLRSEINPQVETGHGGDGYQLEAAASYRLTESVWLGAGARYWSFYAPQGNARFPDGPSPMKFWSDRATYFLQASYTFGDARN
jgi:opacity protein-like surface antigen